MVRSLYSRWDGSQEGPDLGADDLVRYLADELFEHGDLDQALRRLAQQGFVDRWGVPVAGLRELYERVRRRRQSLVSQAFADLSQSLSALPPEALRRATAMLGELNQLVERWQSGEDVQAAFEGFMGRYGDMVPGRPATLEQLLEAMAQEAEAVRQLLEPMTAQQRAKLAELYEALLEQGPALGAELGRLAGHLARLVPGQLGDQPGDLGLSGALWGLLAPGPGRGAGALARDLGDLARLEQLLAGAPSPGALAEVDLGRARELLGEREARDLGALGRLAARLRADGLARQEGGRLRLTPKGLRRIGAQALADLYDRLGPYRYGQHPVGRPGPGHERVGETKPYEWGDPFDVSIGATVRNALVRAAQQGGGLGTPVKLAPADFEVERTEALSRAATVVLLDLSMSMPMRGNFVAAKKMAMALHALISSRFPSDYLGVVGFSRYAREIAFAELPAVSWDYEWGTNIQHGLAIARRLLAHRGGTRQVIMVTDGEPTAHWPPGAPEPVFAYPPSEETVRATLAEVARCTREGIRVNTFALDATGYLRRFVEQVAQLNHGRAFFTSPESLGDYVLVDFLEGRPQARQRRRRTGAG